MPDVSKFDYMGTPVDIKDAQARGDIAELKSQIDHVANVKPQPIVAGTYSGTRTTSVYQSIPAGNYHVHIDSVTSTDTDTSTSQLLFTNTAGSSSILSLQLARGTEIDIDITLATPAERIMFYASDTYAHGASDTFEFTNFELGEYYPLMQDVLAVSGSFTNVLNGTFVGEQRISITQDFTEGDYIITCDGITSEDTDSRWSILDFVDGSNNDVSKIYLPRGTRFTRYIHLKGTEKKLFMFAGMTYATSAGDDVTYSNFRMARINGDVIKTSAIYKPHNSVDTRDYMMGQLYRTDRGIECLFDVQNFRPLAGKTYYVSPNGDDSNTGTSSSAPLQSIATAVAKSDAVFIRLMNGVFDKTLLPGHLTSFNRSIAVVANDGAVPVLATCETQTYTKTDGYTYVYETEANSNCVYDAENNAPYARVASVASVEATAGSFYTDGTDTYIHTLDGEAPTDATIKCCLEDDNLWISASGTKDFYFEGITFCGGENGALRVTSDGTYRPNVYAKDCKFFGATTWGAIYLEGCASVLQNCEAAWSEADGYGYHDKTVTSFAYEINCSGHNNGVVEGTKNGSTMHSGGQVIRVNGTYYKNKGPNVADVHDNTKSWNVSCQAYASDMSTVETTQNCDYIISDGTALMWLDTCAGYNSTHSLYVNTKAKAFVRNCALSTIHVAASNASVEAY